MNKHKKILTGILCLLMALLMPATVFAEPAADVIEPAVIVEDLDVDAEDTAIESTDPVVDIEDTAIDNTEPILDVEELAIDIAEETADAVSEPDVALNTDIGAVSNASKLEETNDELLQDYIDRALFPEDYAEVSLQESGASAKLSGCNLKTYNALKKKIKAVAAGTETSTIFQLTKEEMGIPDTYWTASQLGVSSIVSNGAISQKAAEAAFAKLKLDAGLIINALLTDCPYDLYWYEKTIGYEMSGLSVQARHNDKKGEWMLGFSSGTTFTLAVANEYAGGAFTVSKTAAVATALANIKSIVSACASYDDLSKLQYYKDKICDLVSYNIYAANANNSVAYGNPWQLIWVFDGNSSTNVVCEGYAKAFQYLCDLTTFRDVGICCRIVSGTMQSSGGSGPHMWNVVTMNDAKNYLVDVTNCDSGSIGEGNQLFLAGLSATDTTKNVTDVYSIPVTYGNVFYLYDNDTLSVYEASKLKLTNGRYVPHTHSLKQVNAKAATYTSTGNTAYWVCEGCGRRFSNSSMTKEVTVSQTTLPKLIKISTTSISLKPSVVYSGKARKPVVTVKDGTKTLKANTDYKVSYANNKKIGTATVTIKGINNYGGSVKKTFKIVPKATSVSRLTPAKSSLTVKWKKQAVQTTGYQIQYSTSKKFKSNVKTITVKGAKKTAGKITKLKSKTTWYVRVRTYKKAGKKVYYSAWSKVKGAKVK